MVSDEIVKDLPKALISWYDFQTDSKVLFISGGKPECEVLFDAMKENGIDTVRVDMGELHTISGKFDYIVAAGIIERSENPEEMLAALRLLLKSLGKLLIGAENRLAIRYFCGDKDSFSGHVLDGIDGYIKVSENRRKINGGRAYSKAEYEKMLSQAGFDKWNFYAVMPELVRPQLLLAEDYVPNEAMM